PQPYYQVRNPFSLFYVLKNSLLHRCYLTDLFGTDFLSQKKRIQVTVVLWNYTANQKVYLQFFVNKQTPTLTTLWFSATWLERELWEMFGVVSVGHTDLRRLLTDYGFQGFPLLKDFPVTGYVELRYSEKQKRVVSRAVSFVQEFRLFDFQSPWQK
ncbi:hypothetical protein EON73_01045, partial [bacterium]